MASISCRCAKVTCTFSEAQPRHSVECCCVDCYDKNAYYAKAGGAEPLPLHGNGCPLQLSYFGAKISVKGQEHLAFSKVREGADSTNAYASCCSTLLFVVSHSHPSPSAFETPRSQWRT
eukprot:COSAG02_NODE_2064_length_9963_cov_5.638179_5_plen_119_part_00